MRSLVPARVRQSARSALGGPALDRRMDQLDARLDRLETMLLESKEEGWERSRARWRSARPDSDLTWGAEIGGEAFVDAAARHGAFGAEKTILEIGPGYGRLLNAARMRNIPFRSWVGVDLSAENVAHLQAAFPDDSVKFRQADVEAVTIGEPIDTVISSLTFKHLFPSFEVATSNLAPQLRQSGLVIFDLIEGARRYFEDDGVTYIRCYSKSEVEELLRASGLKLAAFDEVEHHPAMTRMLVVARRPG